MLGGADLRADKGVLLCLAAWVLFPVRVDGNLGLLARDQVLGAPDGLGRRKRGVDCGVRKNVLTVNAGKHP